MHENGKIVKLIYKAVDEVNRMLPEEMRLKKSQETELFGDTGPLDSLGILNLIVATEEKIEESLNTEISLASELNDESKKNHLKTIASLAAYIETQLK